MIKKVRLFVNDNVDSREIALLLRSKLIDHGFIMDDEDYDLGMAVGGDGSFLRMVKQTNFRSDVYYIGINAGTLGFMQEVKIDEIDYFIEELKQSTYKVEEIGIQETVINYRKSSSRFYSLNEIVIRDNNLKVVKLDIKIDDDLLESFCGDGLLVASSYGSTAHNLSYGGSIIYNTFSSLQITPIGPINSKVYKTLINSIVIPDRKVIGLYPIKGYRNLIVTIDGENHIYKDVDSIETFINEKRIKFLRLSHYNFPQKIREKLLS